jgi:two-component system, cell cycle sensor histidine kinase and response regulator CckA
MGIGPGIPPGPGDLHFRCSRGGAQVETILVVDDEDDIRVVVRKMLEAKGYTVLDARDPHQALRIVTQQPVHLLLTDVVMPLMRGTELAQRFQAVSPWTKVLLMSAYKVAEIAASGHPFIPKPFTPDALAMKVRQVLLAQPSPFARRTRSDP